MPTVRHVFVYGTLRRGEQRDINRLQPAPLWQGWASVKGVLYDLGAYPGLLLSESGQGASAQERPGEVLGEVYQISAGLEQQLDVIEEVWPQPSGEYVKRELRVRLAATAPAAGVEVVCVVYEVAASRTAGKPVIGGGDWVRYRVGKTARF